jgi:hypothetical protein
MTCTCHMQMLSHQGVTCRGRAAILSKLEEVVRQQQQCQQHQHQQQPNSSQAGQPAWQLTNVDRQSLLQVRSSGSRVGREVFSESAQQVPACAWADCTRRCYYLMQSCIATKCKERSLHQHFVHACWPARMWLTQPSCGMCWPVSA